MHISITELRDLDYVGVVFGIALLCGLGAEMLHSRGVPPSRGGATYRPFPQRYVRKLAQI